MTVTNTDNLIKNMTDQMKEVQIKLGYAKETIRLYYPLGSLMAILGIDNNIITEKITIEEMQHILQESKELQSTGLGKLIFNVHGGRLEISVPPEGAEYVNNEVDDPAFLTEIIAFFGAHHHCSIEDVKKIFERYSKEYVCEKTKGDMDFDYVLYFKDSSIDPYYYCIKEEMGHTIYHRFSREDYLSLIS